jgi:hypothetical protein
MGFLFLIAGAILMGTYYTFTYGIPLLFIGIVILGITYWKRETNGEGGGESSKIFAGVFGALRSHITQRQDMMRDPFYQEIPEVKIPYRPIENFHKDTAFLFQDSGVVIQDEKLIVGEAYNGTYFVGRIRGRPDIDIGLTDEEKKAKRQRKLSKWGLMGFGGFLLFLGLFSLSGYFFPIEATLAISFVVMGLGLIAVGAFLKMPEHYIVPFYGSYKLVYTGYSQKVTESKEIPYKDPESLVIQIYHSFRPTQEALKNPRVEDRSKYFDYITTRIQKVIESQPREVTVITSKDEDISFVISGRVCKYEDDLERDVNDEIFDRWPVHEARHSAKLQVEDSLPKSYLDNDR